VLTVQDVLFCALLYLHPKFVGELICSCVFFGKVEGGLGLFCTGLRSCSFLSCFPGIVKVRNLA
jgi:hypothetical protein